MALMWSLVFCSVFFVTLSHTLFGTSDSSISEIVEKAFQTRTETNSPITVQLASGRYALKETLFLPPTFFSSSNSGNVRSSSSNSSFDLPPLIIRGPSDRSAILDGGIQLTAWTPCYSVSWLFCSILSVPMQTVGVDQLWVNGARRFVARTSVMMYNRTVPQPNTTIAYTIVAQPGQLKTFQHLDTLRVGTYHSWTASYHTVRSVDLSTNTIIVNNPIQTMFDDSASGQRYWIENAFELLTENSGQFYYDKITNQVIYAPLPEEISEKMMNVSVFAATIIELVKGSQASNVHFENVVFEHAAVDWSVCLSGACDDQSANFLSSAALHWESSSNITLTNVTVRHVGGYGVWMSAGVSLASLSYCRIHDVGAGALRIGEGSGGVDPRVTKSVSVQDSVLEDGGHVFHMGCGVLLQAATQCTVSHNDINTFRYTGISVGWTWSYVPTSESNHEISFNKITTIGMRDLSDMACVYHLGLDNGTKIVNNVCSNVTSFGYGGWGYYTDQASRNVLLQNNIAYDIKCAGFHQHYGVSNVLNNNIFAFVNVENCDGAIRSSAHDTPGDEGDISNFTFNNNIVYWGLEPTFYATTKNSFMNTSFSSNVYYNFNGSVAFPCPISGRDFLSTGNTLQTGEYLSSQNQQAFALMGSDGRFCTYKGGKPPASDPLWCTPNTPAPGISSFIAMQGDGNLCVYTNNPMQDMWCDMVHPGSGDYYLQLLDDFSLCVHQGDYPKGNTIWCANSTIGFTMASKSAFQLNSSPYPTSCSFQQWQNQDRDTNGMIVDPLFVDSTKRDFTLQPSSPALQLGFQQIDTSTVGPR